MTEPTLTRTRAGGGDVLVEMLTGAVRPAVIAAGPATVEACSALLGALDDRTMHDLERVAAPAERARKPRRRA